MTDPKKAPATLHPGGMRRPVEKAPAPLLLHSGGMHPVHGWLMRSKPVERVH
jgi:hypothetical protein